jgi:hypothetical protein
VTKLCSEPGKFLGQISLQLCQLSQLYIELKGYMLGGTDTAAVYLSHQHPTVYLTKQLLYGD